jgi:hypothetical protein
MTLVLNNVTGCWQFTTYMKVLPCLYVQKYERVKKQLVSTSKTIMFSSFRDIKQLTKSSQIYRWFIQSFIITELFLGKNFCQSFKIIIICKCIFYVTGNDINNILSIWLKDVNCKYNCNEPDDNSKKCKQASGWAHPESIFRTYSDDTCHIRHVRFLIISVDDIYEIFQRLIPFNLFCTRTVHFTLIRYQVVTCKNIHTTGLGVKY